MSDPNESVSKSSCQISKIRRAVIIGAGHGIGQALATALLKIAPEAQIFASYHRAENAGPLLQISDARLRPHHLDPLQPESLHEFQRQVAEVGSVDLLINAIGFLHDERFGPERSLAHLNLEQLQHTFAVNSFVTPLLAKAFKPLLLRDKPSAFVALSAMVGSIGENELGGWHSYRASKAALNMFIKNIALEFRRTGLPQCSVLAIHPGTTDTELSRPFSKNVKHQIWTPTESAAHILQTIESASLEGSGLFKNWDGRTLAW